MLRPFLQEDGLEAGCDEAGRGSLAGPVVAAAVILPKSFSLPLLNDSKKLNARIREELAPVIKSKAVSWAVAFIDNHEIDRINILNASIKAMHQAIGQLSETPDRLLIDGNRFKPYKKIPFHCIVGGDGLYASIAAASVLAKTERDVFMRQISKDFPSYQWARNKGYPTPAHRKAIIHEGPTPYHRKSFRLYPSGRQTSLFA